MKRKGIISRLAILFCTVLVLGINGCGEKNAEKQISSAEEKTEASKKPSILKETYDSVESKNEYDDSLIRDAASLEDNFQGLDGAEHIVSIHLPEILSEDEQAKVLNKKIMEIWGGLLKKDKEDYCYWFDGGISVSWEAHWHESLLSLVITEERPEAGTEYEVFYYDFDKKREYTSSEVQQLLSIPQDTLKTSLLHAVAQRFDDYFNDGMVGAPEEVLLLRAKTLAFAEESIQWLSFYPQESDSLAVYAGICVSTNNKWLDEKMEVPLTWQSDKLHTESDFITADADEDGVKIRFQKKGNGAIYQEEYGFKYDTDYPVRGCFGNYKKLFIGSMGPDYAPVLFLLTDQNTIEFVRIFDGLFYDSLVSSGPIYGIGAAGDMNTNLPKIMGFKVGTNEVGGTVYVDCDNGTSFDLSVEVNSGRDRYPEDLFAAWQKKVPQADGSEITYSMAILGFETMGEFVFTESGEGYNVEYDGFLDYLGTDETGLLYGYKVTGPDGNDVTGTFTFLPRYGVLRVGIAGGVEWFDVGGYLDFDEVMG